MAGTISGIFVNGWKTWEFKGNPSRVHSFNYLNNRSPVLMIVYHNSFYSGRRVDLLINEDYARREVLPKICEWTFVFKINVHANSKF